MAETKQNARTERSSTLSDVMREILTGRYTDGMDGTVERQYRRVVNECGRSVPQYDDPANVVDET